MNPTICFLRSVAILILMALHGLPSMAWPQIHNDTWFVGRGDGIWVYANFPSFTWRGLSFGEIRSRMAVTGDGVMYASYSGSFSGAAEVYTLPYGWVYQPMRSTPAVGFSDRAIVVNEDRVFTLYAPGLLVSLARTIAPQSALFHGDIYSVIGPPGPNGGYVNDMATNGRDVFIATSRGVYVIDIEKPFQVRLLYPHGAYSVGLGPDGWLLIGRWTSPALDGVLMVHPRTGASRIVPNGPSGQSLTISSQFFGYNPWNDELVIGGYAIVWGLLHDSSTWQSRVFNPWDPNGLSLVSGNFERPFLLSGKGCLNGLGKEPRLGWRGLPLRGTSFDVTLSDAEPNTMMAFWLGTSRSWSPGLGPLPFDAGSFGAPGCSVLAAPDVMLLGAVDAQGDGSVSITVPPIPALAGLKLYGQSASMSSANALGLASSESLVVRFR